MYLPPPPARDPFLDFGRCVVASVLGVTASCAVTGVLIGEPAVLLLGLPYALLFAGPGGVVVAAMVLFAVRRIERPRRAVILAARAARASLRRTFTRRRHVRVSSPAAALARVDVDTVVDAPQRTAIGAALGALLAFVNIPAWVILAVIDDEAKAAVVFLAAGAVVGAWMGRGVAAEVR